MNLDEYAPLALRTAGDRTFHEHLCNGGLGLAGEAGEVADAIKKVVFHQKPMDVDHLIAELGDCAWYLNLLIHNLGTTWEEVLERNIKKLSARYPEGFFDPERANNRDVEAEQAAMAK